MSLRVTMAGTMNVDDRRDVECIVLEGPRDSIRDACQHMGCDVYLVSAPSPPKTGKRTSALKELSDE